MFDPGERDIKTGADARACPHVPVDHPARLRDPARTPSPRRHGGECRFVGRRLAAVEDAGARGEARARADGDEVVERRVHGAQEVELGLQVRRPRPQPPRHK